MASRVDLSRTVRRLRAVTGRTSLEVAVQSGRVVAEELLGGDIRAWRDRTDRLIGDLAAMDGAPSSATLYRAMASFELYTRMGPSFRLDRLNTSHLRAVTGLPLPVQVRLLGRAGQLGWSAKMLRAEAEPRKERVHGRRGRPRTDPVLRALAKAERELECAAQENDRSRRATSPGERAQIASALERLRAECGRLRSLLFPGPRLVPNDAPRSPPGGGDPDRMTGEHFPDGN